MLRIGKENDIKEFTTEGNCQRQSGRDHRVFLGEEKEQGWEERYLTAKGAKGAEATEFF